MSKVIRTSLGVLLCLSLVACGSSPKKTNKDSRPQTAPQSSGQSQPSANQTGSQSSGANQAVDADGNPISAAAVAAPAQKQIYFTYNSSALESASRAILDQHVAYLLKNPGYKIRVEGHADERGSREYNLALGESRAQTVQRYFNIAGAAGDRVATFSYGEEKPLDAGSSERAWTRNRRVEIIY